MKLLPGPVNTPREKHLRDQRDLARDVAANLEGMVASAAALHANTTVCAWHGRTAHGCGSPALYHCDECDAYSGNQPCKTLRSLEGEWTP